MRASPGRTYQYLDEALAPPLYRYGHGLSYGSTTFGPLVAPASLDVCAELELRVQLEHRGAAGDVPVLVFMSFHAPSVPVPNIQLVAFNKAYNMTDGERRTLSLTVGAAHRAVITNATFVRTVEPSQAGARFWVGDAQPAGLAKRAAAGRHANAASGGDGAFVDVAFTGVATALADCGAPQHHQLGM